MRRPRARRCSVPPKCCATSRVCKPSRRCLPEATHSKRRSCWPGSSRRPSSPGRTSRPRRTRQPAGPRTSRSSRLCWRRARWPALAAGGGFARGHATGSGPVERDRARAGGGQLCQPGWGEGARPQLDVAQRTALTASRFAEQTIGNSQPVAGHGETPMGGGSMFRSAAVAEGKGRTEQEGGTRAGDALGDAPPDPLLGAGGERLSTQLKQAGISGLEAEGKDGSDARFYADSREQKAFAGWRSARGPRSLCRKRSREQRRYFHPASSDRKGLLHDSPRGRPMSTATVDQPGPAVPRQFPASCATRCRASSSARGISSAA